MARELCSTPFGITGCYAKPSRRCRLESVVLNAFRHHRVLRRHRPGRRHDLQDVLNAFRHHRVLRLPPGPATVRPTVCAQRLSASQGATPKRRTSSVESPRSCSTPFGITGCYAVTTLATVWGSIRCSTPFGITGCYASLISISPCSPSQCSTPFGITGCYACLPRQPARITVVLNAFRHHRVLRGHSRTTLATVWGSIRCSTPFGITGCYARSSRVGLELDFVLNAFRHHRVLRNQCMDSHRYELSAQRLSASQGATPGRRIRKRDIVVVLNAFRHHRVLRLQCNWLGRIQQMCSTPFGITGCYAVGS